MSHGEPGSHVAHFIGVVAGLPLTFEGRVHIEVGEYDELVEAAAKLRAVAQQDTFRLVIWSHRGFEQAVARIRTMAQTKPTRLAWPDYDEISVTLLDWLLSVRLFLDHTRFELTSRFGSDSTEANDFKAATNAEHSAHAAYRLVYDLRDYSTHRGMPPVGLNMSAHLGAPSTLDLFLDPPTLLQWRKWHSRTKADLMQAAAPIDVCQIVEEAMSCLRRLLLVRRGLLEADQRERAQRLVGAVERLEGAEGEPALLRMTFDAKDRSVRAISPTPIPIALARRMVGDSA